MAQIRPFQGYRPKEGLESEIAALPYDVYNRAEAKQAVKDHPLSFLNIDRAETQFDDSVDTYDPKVYQKAHDLLWQMINDGNFVQEDKPPFKERLHGFDAAELIRLLAAVAPDGNLVACGVAHLAELVEHQILNEVALHVVHHRDAPRHVAVYLIVPGDHCRNAGLVGVRFQDVISPRPRLAYQHRRFEVVRSRRLERRVGIADKRAVLLQG